MPNGCVIVDHSVDSVSTDDASPRALATLSVNFGLLGKGGENGVRQTGNILRRQNPSSIINDLCRITHIGDHARSSDSHGLDQNDRKSFADTAQYKDIDNIH